MLTQSRLREVLIYNLESGLFTWKVSLRYGDAGKVAGTPDKDGYITIRIDGHSYRANRLAFLYVLGRFPNGVADHIDQVVTNNAWNNLREATYVTNGYNRKNSSNNTSGVKGVYWDKVRNKWVARISVNKRRLVVGEFNKLSDAEAAIVSARNKYHGEFANHGL